jgi:hypothetical protein
MMYNALELVFTSIGWFESPPLRFRFSFVRRVIQFTDLPIRDTLVRLSSSS